MNLTDWPIGDPVGRDLEECSPGRSRHKRVVACLNVWNDYEELTRTLPSWYPFVDHVLAIDGAYAGTRARMPWSDDGTLEYLRRLEKVELIETRAFWPNQAVKRSEFFRRTGAGDLLFIIDADELVEDAQALADLPELEVGWVRVKSPIYRRWQSQPRLMLWRPGLEYRGRHHWIFAGHGDLVASHQVGGAGVLHRVVPIWIENSRGAYRKPERQIAGEMHREAQSRTERAIAGPPAIGNEPLHIAQVGPFDPAGVIERLHTGINASSPHASVMFVNDEHLFGYPYQYRSSERATIEAIEEAGGIDLLHCHVTDYGLELPFRAGLGLVMHHHGTEYRRHPEYWNDRDRQNGARLRLVSNLELLQYGDGLAYLPNPVPVARYAAWRKRTRWRERSRPLLIGHSPSKRELKGTRVFLSVVERLAAQGLAIAPKLIEGVSIRESLTAKASCDLFFDSFFLGMQCSGLEAAAMGLPVIAGDPEVHDQSLGVYGYVPYTYADNELELEAAIVELVEDAEHRKREAERVYTHVRRHHDSAAVVQTYLELLEDAFGWREARRLGYQEAA